MKNFHKESSGILEALERPQALSRPATAPNPGSAPGGIGPLRSRSAVGTRPGRIPHHPPARPAATGARCTQRAPKRKTGSILAPPFEMLPERSLLPERSVRATASNLDTLSRPIARSKSVHAVEFSKTVAPLRGGESSLGARPGPNDRSRGGPTSIALSTGVVSRRRKSCDASLVRSAQLRTWTLTVRSRARSSKSMSTICCQVPSARRPSSTGIVSDGPISAARRWAWELVSWLSRLCS